MTRNECLHAGGAVFDGDVVRSHGDAGAEVLHAEGGALLVALGHHDRLRIAGPDAAGFLNRLLTVDVLHLAPGQGARPFLLDAKGKILLAFHLLRVDEQTYLVECSAGHGEDVAARLDMFHFGEALTIEPVDDAFTVITLQGGGAAGVLEALDVRPPEAAWAHAEATIAGHPVRVARVDRAGLPGFDLWLAPDAFAAVWQAARDAGATPSGVDALEVLRVDHGVPGHPNEFGPHAVPLELSVEDGYTEGKGCYPGQEVIERTLALGRPARQLLRLTLDGPADVGADLLSEGRVAGVLTSVATRPDGVVVGLALVKRKYLDAEAFTCGDVAAHPPNHEPRRMTEYEKYIRTAELLALQKPRDAQVCHDELAFQVVHQVEELWMKLALQEVDLLVERIDADRLVEAMDVLKRLREILRLMAGQMVILETLSPRSYFTIRGALGRGSGQESPGFNQMLETRRPIRRALRDLFERRSVDLLALHRDPSADPEVFALTEALVDYDEGFQHFRYRHLALVRRIIGGRTPSLKGAPAELLEHGVRQSFFPELWQVREALFRDFTPGRPLFDDTDPAERPLMAKDWERLGGETGKKVDTSRLGRAMRLGRLGARFAGSAIKAGLSRRGDDEGEGLDTMARAAMKNAEHIVDVMGQMKGAAMKVGQLLSADPDLVAPEFADALTRLQREAPPMTFQTVSEVIEGALDRPLSDVFRFFDPTPLGAASIGQVHRATLFDGREVAVKVQYPGIADSLDSDLRNLAGLMKFSRVFMTKDRADAFVKEAREAILIEADYTREAANLARFRELLADWPDVVVPEPVPELSRANLLVMQFVEGSKFDDAVIAIEDRDRRSALVSRFVELFVFMFHELNELHADPHPGNFMLTPDQRIVLLDFGCIRAFRPELADGVLEMLVAFWDDDMEALAAIFRRFGFGREGMVYPDAEVLRTYHRMILEPLLVDAPFNFSTFSVHQKARAFIRQHPSFLKMVPPAELLLYFRVIAGVKGLLTRIDADVNLRAMAEATCRHRGILP